MLKEDLNKTWIVDLIVHPVSEKLGSIKIYKNPNFVDLVIVEETIVLHDRVDIIFSAYKDKDYKQKFTSFIEAKTYAEQNNNI